MDHQKTEHSWSEECLERTVIQLFLWVSPNHSAEQLLPSCSGERESLRDLPDVHKHLMGHAKEIKWYPFSVVPHWKEEPSEHKKTLFAVIYCDSACMLVQVTQRSCGVSIPGDALSLSGHSPGKCGKPALAAHALSKVVRSGELQRYTPTSVVLSSVINNVGL